MSGDLALGSAPTYAVVDKKAKARKKKPEKADPAMEMYSVIDDSTRARSASKKPLTDSVDDEEVPTYDMVDHQTRTTCTDAAYSKFDRTGGVASKTPPTTSIPAKKEDSQKRKCAGVGLASVILAVVLSVILVVLLIALVVAFVQIVNLRSRVNTLKTSAGNMPTASDSSTGNSINLSTDALNTSLIMLQMNFEDLKSTINSLFENVTNETLTDIREREEMLNAIAPTFYSALNTLEEVVPRNLSEIERNTNERLTEITRNVTSTLAALRLNVTEELSQINEDVQDRLRNIELVANQTILQRTSQ